MANKTPLGLKRRSSKSPARVSPESRLAAGRSLRTEQAAAVPAEQIFAFDPALVLARLVSGKTSREYYAEESVFSQGEPANAVFYIETGKVKLTVVSQAGKEAVVAILPEGSFFGEGCLAGQLIRISTAKAVTPSTVVRVDRTVMLSLLHGQPDFAERFLGYLLSRNIRMEADLVDHLFNSSEKRLARLLLLMANFGQESKPIPVIAKMSQETLAEMIGTTRSRVSFFLNRFRDLGFINYNGDGMHVNSSLISVVLHD
jgi:CRP/FNR family transcriptional regulator, cyclic AMP receptor protein